MTDETLFSGYEPVEPEPAEPLSADRRRTQRQADLLAIGRHPLTGGVLHDLASRHRDASSPKDDPYTCGSCVFRKVLGYHNKSYPKCMEPGSTSADTYERHGPPFVSNSAATDVRAWWPACPRYSPGDRISDDAARCIPGESS